MSDTVRQTGWNVAVNATGAAILFVPLAFNPLASDAFALPKQVVLLSLSGGVLFACLALGGTLALSAWPRWIQWLAMGALIWELIAIAGAADPWTAAMGEVQYRQGLFTHLAMAVLFLAAVTAFREPPAAAQTVLFWATAIVAVSAYAWLQSTGLDPISWTSGTVFSTLGTRTDLAVFAVQYAGFMGLLVGMSVTTRLTRVSLWTAIIWMVIAAGSRSGYLGLAVCLTSGCALLWLRHGRIRVIHHAFELTAASIAAIAVLVGSGSLFASSVAPARVQEAPSDFSLRAEIWGQAVELISQKPLIGWGPTGLFVLDVERSSRLQDYQGIRVLTSPHSAPLEIALSVGLPGLTAMFVFLAWITWKSGLAIQRRILPERSGFALAALLGWGVMALLNPLTISASAGAVVLLALLLAGAWRPIQRGSQPGEVAM